MELNKYQKRAMSTCMESCDNITYMLLNLIAEVGEYAERFTPENFVEPENEDSKEFIKILRQVNDISVDASILAKKVRKNEANVTLIGDSIHIEKNRMVFNHLAMIREAEFELGDILWQLAGNALQLKTDLNTVAKENLAKLQDRKKRNVIEGEGDHR